MKGADLNKQTSNTLVLALGNPLRSDDGLGYLVIEELSKKNPHHCDYLYHGGDSSDLIDLWQDRNVLVVDALRMEQYPPGEILVINSLWHHLKLTRPPMSSHGVSLAEALGLGTVVDKTPLNITLAGIVGKNFENGPNLSTPVARAMPDFIQIILQLSHKSGWNHKPRGGISMHEISLMQNLMQEISDVAKENGALRVKRVAVEIGPWSHLSVKHFRDHFLIASKNSLAEDAVLDIVETEDERGPLGQGILLKEIEIDYA